jgi:malate dehydrogenase (oxaloacetate-decarboxylating)(NADP+)
MASTASGRDARDHRVVFLGGGSAAVGYVLFCMTKADCSVAKEMMNYFTMLGLSEQEARERFWLIDTKVRLTDYREDEADIQGLITHSRPDVVAGKLASHKKYFIRNDTTAEFGSLAEVIEHVKPTALVGLSTTFGAFPEPVVRRMAALNTTPIIFPLSNPTSKCELSFSDALNWTDGKVLFASGSPYPSMEHKGTMREPGQGNNFLVFPGIGFGALACGATKVTDQMITASALGLSESLTKEEKEAGLLYPRLERIREVSASVAARVVKAAQEGQVDTVAKLRGCSE